MNKKNDFYVNGRVIDKQKNLKKNNINDGDIILIE